MPTRIALGCNHTCALTADGVRCWGLNSHGQANVPQLDRPTSITAGANHTCALTADGVKCWGANGSGQINVPALNRPTAVSAGGAHNCALTADGIRCWGANDLSQTSIHPLAADSISLGKSFSCVLSGGSPRCWMYWDSRRQYIRSDLFGWNDAASIAAGGQHVCALFSNNGGIQCKKGEDDYGEVQVPSDLIDPTMVSAGSHHTCALANGEVKCWGAGGTYLPVERYWPQSH